MGKNITTKMTLYLFHYVAIRRDMLLTSHYRQLSFNIYLNVVSV